MCAFECRLEGNRNYVFVVISKLQGYVIFYTFEEIAYFLQ